MEEEIIYPKKKIIEWLKVVVGDMEKNMRFLAPNGWEASPYFAFRHPTPEQQYKSYIHFCKRTNLILKKKEALPTFEEYMEDYQEEEIPIKPEIELHELIGSLLYNLNGIEFNDPSGIPIALEGGRGGAEFVSQFLNMHYPLDQKEFIYLDFFNISSGEEHIDALPIWLLFFRRMKENSYDMFYQIKNDSSELPTFVRAYQEVYGKNPLLKRK